MKKNIIWFLLLTAFNTKGQQFITYKIKYLSQHRYTTNSTTTASTEMDLDGAKEEKEKFNVSSGMQFPIKVNSESHLLYNIKTGSLSKDNEIPFVISYPSVYAIASTEGQKDEQIISPLFSKKLYGQIISKGKFILDSVGGKPTGNILQQAADETIQSLQKETQASEHSLSVGKSFSKKIPLELPFIKQFIKPAELKITYTLKEIKDDKAYFDLSLNAEFNYYTKIYTIKVRGLGTGKMIYDVANNIIASQNSAVDCTFTREQGTRTLKGSGKIVTETTTTVE